MHEVVASTGVSKSDVSKVVDRMLQVVRANLDSGESVTLRGFGTFKVTETAARKGRNPATGEAIDIPAGRRIGF
ncbi:MAG: HU family DNA-binding protein, partial [Chloroflexota bacterium]|nr:HU family DNA-binding protein [Chloroflexota bacterium]